MECVDRGIVSALVNRISLIDDRYRNYAEVTEMSNGNVSSHFVSCPIVLLVMWATVAELYSCLIIWDWSINRDLKHSRTLSYIRGILFPVPGFKG